MEHPIDQAAVRSAVPDPQIMPKSAAQSWQSLISPDLAVHPKLKDRSLEDILRDYLNPKAICDANGPDDYPLAQPSQPALYDQDLAQVMRQIMFDAGLTKAQAIVEYREKHGPFKSAEDLSLVKGIGDRTVELNRDNIKVSKSDKK